MFSTPSHYGATRLSHFHQVIHGLLRISVAALLTLATLGCTRPYAIYTIQGTPAAEKLRATKPVSTRIEKGSSVLTQKYQAIVINELKKPTSGFKYDPKSPELILHIVTSRDDPRIASSAAKWAPFMQANHAVDEGEEIVVALWHQTEDGHTVWEGSMRGSGDWLAGPKAPACVRVLFTYFDHNESGEESCHWN